MLDFVAQQWLLIDFEHDFQMLNLHSSLPSNLNEKKVITIAGNHILQVYETVITTTTSNYL